MSTPGREMHVLIMPKAVEIEVSEETVPVEVRIVFSQRQERAGKRCKAETGYETLVRYRD
jgi:hypothetical protein